MTLKNIFLKYIILILFIGFKPHLIAQFNNYRIPTHDFGPGNGMYIQSVNIFPTGGIDELLNITNGPDLDDYYVRNPFTGTTLKYGTQYTLMIQGGSTNSVTYYKVWLDHVHDGQFESFELLGSGTSSSAYEYIPIEFTVPNVNMYTRIRIRCSEDPSMDSYSSVNYGETEDYYIRISEAYSIPINQMMDPPYYLYVTDKILMHAVADMDADGDYDLITIHDHDREGGTFNILSILWNENNILRRQTLVSDNGRSKFDLPISTGKLLVNDFNNDGELDILMTGDIRYTGGSNSYTDYKKIQILIQDNKEFNVSFSQIDNNLFTGSGIGDIDSDGDRDFHVNNLVYENKNGNFYFNGKSKSYYNIDWSDNYNKNNYFDFNNNGLRDLIEDDEMYSDPPMMILDIPGIDLPPTIPQNLSIEISRENNTSILRWEKSTDTETGFDHVSYNIFLGSLQDKNDIISSNSLENGLRKVTEIGNAGFKDSILVHIETGINYQWGVQAIDQSNNGSAFNVGPGFNNESFIKTSVRDNRLAGDFELYDKNNDGNLEILYAALTFDFENGFVYGGSNTEAYGEASSLLCISDFNNDSKIDYIVTSSEGYIVSLQNQDSYTINNNNYSGAICSGDLNNDGYIDAFCSPYIYINDGDGILLKADSLGKYEIGKIADMDNDGDNDIILDGHSVYIGGSSLFLFENTPEGYLKRSIGIANYGGSIDLGDYDNDGDLDILTTGKDIPLEGIGNRSTTLIQNNGNLNFYGSRYDIIGLGEGRFEYGRFGSSVTGRSYGAFADYNNDGMLDLILSGSSDDGSVITGFFRNSDYGSSFNYEPTGIENSVLAPFLIGDIYNNDGDLDIMVFGASGGTYENIHSDKNEYPSSPSGLKIKYQDSNVILEWDSATDPESGNSGLTYNLRVGSKSLLSDIISPLSDSLTGKRRIYSIGSQGTNFNWLLKNLDPGTYYWSVQAIDNSFNGGPWAPEQTFTVTNLRAEFSSDTVCLGEETDFTDLTYSTDTIDSWFWDFGNGKFSSEQNPAVTFDSPGEHIVKLLVASNSLNDSITDTVFVKQVPEANFISNVVCDGNATTFENLTNKNGLTIEQWTWDFGDESPQSYLEVPAFTGYLLPGDYSVKMNVTATNQCSDSIVKTAHLSEYPDVDLTMRSSYTPNFCSGDSTILEIDYIPEYNYQWLINGAPISEGISDTLLVKQTGNFSATITNPIGNCITKSDTISIQVNQTPSDFSISSSINPAIICSGDSVMLSVPDTEGYIYDWKNINGASLGIFQSQVYIKESGVFYVVYTNPDGCMNQSVNEIEINVNPFPIVPTVSNVGSLTFCEDAFVELSVDENADYYYQWKVDGNIINGAISNVYYADSTGSYSLNVSTAEGCAIETESKDVTVNSIPESPTIETSGPTTFCSSDSVILSVTENSNYTYSWKLNGGTVGSDTSKIIAKTSGIYTLAVSNSNGCSVDAANEIAVTVNPIPVIPTVSNFGPLTFCEGAGVELSVDQNIDYSYQWKVDGSIISEATQNVYSAAASGSYALSVSTAEGCAVETAPKDVTVHQIPESPTIITSGPTTFCSYDSVILSVTGNPDYTYAWKLNGGSTGTDSNTLIAKASGTYSLLVSNANGCSVNAANEIEVTVNPVPVIPTVSNVGPLTFCEGGSVELSVDANADYSYQWKVDGGTINGAANNIYNAASSGNYSLNVSSREGCAVETATKEVFVNPIPESPTIIASGPTTFCSNDSVILSVTGNPDYTYAWKLNGGSTGTDSNTLIAKASGTYSLLVSNANDCKVNATNEIEVTVNPVPIIPTVSNVGPLTFCEGGSVELSVDANADYSYQWKVDGGTINGAANNIYNATSSGNYYLNVSSPEGCAVETATKKVVVNPIPESPTIVASGPTTFCSNDSVTLSVTVNTDYTYAWKLNGGSTGTDSNTIIAKASGTYSLMVSNNISCSVDASNKIEVTVNPVPVTPTVNNVRPLTFCEGDSVDLTIDIDPDYSYVWKLNNGTVDMGATGLYTAKTSGSYTVTVSTDEGCRIESEQKIVTVNALPAAPSIRTTGSTTFCESDSIIFTVTERPGYSYAWKDGSSFVGQNANTYIAKTTGSYSINITDPSGCEAQSENTIDVVVHDNPIIKNFTANDATTICEGDSMTISVQFNTAHNYQWLKDGNIISYANSNQYSAKDGGTYQLRIINEYSCTALSKTAKVTVMGNDYQPNLTFLAGSENVCPEESVIIGLSNPLDAYSYILRPSGTVIGKQTNFQYEISDEGIYWFSVQAAGCEVDSRKVQITHKSRLPRPEISAIGPNYWYLAVSNDSAGMYRWYLDGVLQEESNDHVYVAGEQLGKYYAEISEDGECYTRSDVISIPDNIVLGTVEAIDPWENLKIYPNPTPGLFTLEMDNPIMGELIIDIFGDTGARIINIKFHKELNHFKTEIDLSDQPAGIYLIGLELDKYRTTRSLIVK